MGISFAPSPGKALMDAFATMGGAAGQMLDDPNRAYKEQMLATITTNPALFKSLADATKLNPELPKTLGFGPQLTEALTIVPQSLASVQEQAAIPGAAEAVKTEQGAKTAVNTETIEVYKAVSDLVRTMRDAGTPISWGDAAEKVKTTTSQQAIAKGNAQVATTQGEMAVQSGKALDERRAKYGDAGSIDYKAAAEGFLSGKDKDAAVLLNSPDTEAQMKEHIAQLDREVRYKLSNERLPDVNDAIRRSITIKQWTDAEDWHTKTGGAGTTELWHKYLNDPAVKQKAQLLLNENKPNPNVEEQELMAIARAENNRGSEVREKQRKVLASRVQADVKDIMSLTEKGLDDIRDKQKIPALNAALLDHAQVTGTPLLTAHFGKKPGDWFGKELYFTRTDGGVVSPEGAAAAIEAGVEAPAEQASKITYEPALIEHSVTHVLSMTPGAQAAQLKLLESEDTAAGKPNYKEILKQVKARRGNVRTPNVIPLPPKK